jgi:GNAT superfamily N-acetyltransferase
MRPADAGGDPAPRYPSELETDRLTRAGTPIHLRPIRPADADGLVDFHERLSTRSVYRRFFFVHPKLSAPEVERFTTVDYVDRLAIVAEDGGRLVAVGRYERTPGTGEAEVAFVVADDYQHHGIGTLLLECLAEAAWQRGVTTFAAQTLAENHDMLGVFVDSGFAVTAASASGTVTIRFPIEPDETYRSAVSARHALAEAAHDAAGASG